MSKPNPVQLQKFLGGIDYPVSRNDLLAHAERAGADEAVLSRLLELPNHTYHGPNAVTEEFAKVG